MSRDKFFRRSDWIACWVTFFVSLAVYIITLQPTVGLEDSGELCVASDYLGVPHPPGYPSWSLLTWLFQWVFHNVNYHGHPNPAWAVNLFSAVAGAAACGVIALLISRSGMDLLRSLSRESSLLGEKTESLFCVAAGISGGLLLAFGQGMWSQSVIAEVYSLNIFFQSLVLVFLYRWVSEPANPKWLIICAFVFGLGITNHQTLMFMGLAIAIAVVLNDIDMFQTRYLWWVMGACAALSVAFIGIWYNSVSVLFLGVIGCIGSCLGIRKPYLARDFVIVGAMFLLLVGMNKWAAETPGYENFTWKAGPAAGDIWYKSGFWIWTLYALLVPIIASFALPRGRIVGPTFLGIFIGLAFYLYMPISSDQNPPINWGYPRTWQGFMHAITRGQYERVKLAHVFSPRFLTQVGTYLSDLRSQFYGPTALLGLISFIIYPLLGQTNGHYFSFKGRIRRFEYLFWTVSWNLLCCVLALLLLPVIMSFESFVARVVTTTVTFLLFCALISIPAVKRLHDIDHPGKLVWIGIIPAILNLLLFPILSSSSEDPNLHRFILFLVLALYGITFLFHLYLISRKGTSGTNSHGEDPLTNELALPNKCWAWMITTIVAFLSVGIIFMILQNPKTDIQSLFIGRVQYIQSHAIYVIWLGYGILLLMAYLEALAKNNLITKVIGVAMVLLLPFSLIYKNAYDKEQLKVYGGADQGGHDFGWQFGNWQLQGVKGIEEDLRAWHSSEEFEKIWAEYPNKEYPPPMDTNAIFFGGTDPGRFVPTYMIYSAKVRQDVYLITQNALADHTYMSVMRDLYGDQIWIPSPLDVNIAFQKYHQQNRNRANVQGEKIQVQGVQNVMKINGILSEMIFQYNQYRTETRTDEKTRPVGAAVVHEDPRIDPETGRPPGRSFYVEESYPMPWMYPYLTPHGLIMKVNNKPTPITAEMIKNDTEFWDWYCDRLLNDRKFMRDIVARKSFSKLRSSIASLYGSRNRPKESEAAFRQAIALYELSPESNYRLAELLTRQGRYEEATELHEQFLEKDPKNEQAKAFLRQLKQRQKMFGRMKTLEQQLSKEQLTFSEVVELAGLYLSSGQMGKSDALLMTFLKHDGLRPEMAMQIAQLAAQKKRFAVVEQALKTYISLKPEDPRGWIDLAALQLFTNKRAEMWKSIDKAIEVDPGGARAILQNDKRFGSVRKTEQYQSRVPAQQKRIDTNLLPAF